MPGGQNSPHNYVYRHDGAVSQISCRCGQRSEWASWEQAVAWANEHTALTNPEWSRRGALANVVVLFDTHEGEREAQVRRLSNDLAGKERSRLPGEARQDSPLRRVREEGQSKPTVRS